jgi:dipeptidyl aminopeptidase/acylaminoacyl peptidase
LGRLNASETLWHVIGAGQVPGYFSLHDQTLALRQRAWSHPQLADQALVSVQPFEFNARDGLRLQGYVTHPEGDSPSPAVVLVHGGPWARDHWTFNPEVQFLAEHGYAVIQVNYRGSRGLGHSLLQSGRRQWGRGMQSDLVAAVQAVSERQLIDPKRVCIMGSSYGGYAALMGVMQSPEVFRCAVARSAVTDLTAQIESLRRQRNRRAYLEWSVMVGDLGGSRADLRAVSPLYHPAKLQRPVLLTHGRLDSTVSFDQAEQLAGRLKQQQAEVRWLPLDEAGHGLGGSDNRRIYYTAVRDFLESQLGVSSSVAE